MDARSSLRNYEIGRVQSCLDGLKVVWLGHIATVDSLPIGWLLTGAFVYLVYRSSQYRKTFTQISEDKQALYRSIFGLRRNAHFGYSDNLGGTSFTVGTYVTDWIILPKKIYESQSLDIIAHEATHVKRGDHALKWCYNNATNYLFYVLGLFPLSVWVGLGFRFPSGDMLPGFVFYWVFLALPGLYLYLSRARHSHHREFIADAEAMLFLPEQYQMQMAALERRTRFGEQESVGEQSHPAALDRYQRVVGARRVPFGDLLGAIVMTGLILPIVGYNVVLGMIYMPGAGASVLNDGSIDPASLARFDPLRFVISLTLLIVSAHLVSKIGSIVTCGYRSGLAAYEKFISTIVFIIVLLPGLIFTAFSFYSVASATIGASSELVLAIICAVLTPFVFLAANLVGTTVYRRCGSPIFLFWSAFGVMYVSAPIVYVVSDFGASAVAGVVVGMVVLLVALDGLPRVVVNESRAYDGARLALRPILRRMRKSDQ